ncbi:MULTISPECIES: chorismate lyase [Rahnella]|uniref:chorismate lyase n=1 Tax=Rahnella TaxID=34037 RepID=UPI0006FCEFC0|nr:chorismate lyase [Rahnella rivi]KQN60675.1 chorismate--pyruvate lyase [Serratia sp. Leaf51]MBB6115275.1 chorismate--pyruvate lyase [Rahnella inusitata]MBU9832051.1 chorismate lyase [Rahnella rivi]THD50833.1 chorismate lyase [Enterobacteriaceae bacterium ML5]
MSDSHSPAQPPIHWFNDPTDVPADVADWLMEMGSMTRRFEKQGVTVTVKPQNECFVTRAELGESEAQQLPESARYWVREIVLFGDAEPWLLGRTVIPEETLTGPDLALVDLGTVPLGRYLFSGNNLTRDYIHLGQLQSERGDLWARRSRLRLSDKPLLLTEIFLPDSPVHRPEGKVSGT